jgi:hypothetical protein
MSNLQDPDLISTQTKDNPPVANPQGPKRGLCVSKRLRELLRPIYQLGFDGSFDPFPVGRVQLWNVFSDDLPVIEKLEVGHPSV